MIVAILLSLIIGYIVGHDVAAHQFNQRSSQTLKEIGPMIETLRKAAEELNKPPQLPAELVREILRTEEHGGRVQ